MTSNSNSFLLLLSSACWSIDRYAISLKLFNWVVADHQRCSGAHEHWRKGTFHGVGKPLNSLKPLDYFKFKHTYAILILIITYDDQKNNSALH